MHSTDLNAGNDYRGYKIITFRLLFTSHDFSYANTHYLIWCCLQIYLSHACHVLTFLVKIFINNVL